ncbi:GAF and ANTAR domain-containing protein [Actinokineospora sp. NBRC 105648]|uniref:GAF and ANTAR domain-containing protein n=1 Tax=Actinokineospora sp. NBRC 105648 TaxID=3032206 RepID=UPI0024A38DCB|nr:GAF and ANTAR domain-containing protein [Actinokineospora sp. NBRC 105648]GLZ43464.1 transcriptional regulator [Actinokineospora sp. NBRC 105648]
MTDVISLAQELAEVARLVEDDELGTAFGRFTKRAIGTIPGCAHASITVRTDLGVVETIGDDPRDVDLLASGPIIEAVTYHEPRRLDDVATDQRWPAFSAKVAQAGLRSCLALPIATNKSAAAVFSLFSDQPGQFGESSHDLVMLLTLHAGVVFDNVSLFHDSTRLVEQLRAALLTRAVVGRAQGLLMHRFGYDTDTAFEALRTASQNSNTKLRDLAAALVEAHDRGDFEETMRRLPLPAAGDLV